MKILKKINAFTLLMAVFSFAFLIRLADIATFAPQKSAAAATDSSQGFQPVPGATAPDSSAASGTQQIADASTPSTADADNTDGGASGNADSATGGGTAPPPIASGDQNFSASEIQILQDLSKRRDELNKRAAEIGQREALLKAAGVEIDRKIAEMNKIRSALENLLNQQKTAEDARLDSLVKIYQNMKPSNAAAIFNAMQMSDLLPVIARMNERKSSPILAAMDPGKAREVTIELENQRRLPRLPADDPCKLKATTGTLTSSPSQK